MCVVGGGGSSVRPEPWGLLRPPHDPNWLGQWRTVIQPGYKHAEGKWGKARCRCRRAGTPQSPVAAAVVVVRKLAVNEPLEGRVALDAELGPQVALHGGIHLHGHTTKQTAKTWRVTRGIAAFLLGLPSCCLC